MIKDQRKKAAESTGCQRDFSSNLTIYCLVDFTIFHSYPLTISWILTRITCYFHFDGADSIFFSRSELGSNTSNTFLSDLNMLLIVFKHFPIPLWSVDDAWTPCAQVKPNAVDALRDVVVAAVRWRQWRHHITSSVKSIQRVSESNQEEATIIEFTQQKKQCGDEEECWRWVLYFIFTVDNRICLSGFCVTSTNSAENDDMNSFGWDVIFIRFSMPAHIKI